MVKAVKSAHRIGFTVRVSTGSVPKVPESRTLRYVSHISAPAFPFCGFRKGSGRTFESKDTLSESGSLPTFRNFRKLCRSGKKSCRRDSIQRPSGAEPRALPLSYELDIWGRLQTNAALIHACSLSESGLYFRKVFTELWSGHLQCALSKTSGKLGT